MRFPFFATNRRLDKGINDGDAQLVAVHGRITKLGKWILDEQQLCQKLEGRVNKLEPNKSQRKRKTFYTRKDWSRMNKKRRKALLATMEARERKYTQKIEEAIKGDRK